MKKIISISLAAAMIFAVCTFSAFAETISTNHKGTNPNVHYLYYVDTKKFNAEGTLSFTPATRAVYYAVSCTNINYDSVTNFHLWAQCAINYADGSQDFDTATIQVLIDHEHGTTLADSFIVPSNKTVISLDAEYQVWHENGTLWEGQIYYPLTLGINA